MIVQEKVIESKRLKKIIANVSRSAYLQYHFKNTT